MNTPEDKAAPKRMVQLRETLAIVNACMKKQKAGVKLNEAEKQIYAFAAMQEAILRAKRKEGKK